jgi:hypothetical protein
VEERLDLVEALAGKEPAVDLDHARAGDHVPLAGSLDHRRRERRREERRHELGGERVQRPRLIERDVHGRDLAEHDLEERPPRDERRGRLRRRAPRGQARLEQGVVGQWGSENTTPPAREGLGESRLLATEQR